MDILSRPVLQADHRIAYGTDPSQFGDLWLPASATSQRKAPLVIFFHGGWWKSEYDLGYAGYLCQRLKQDGIACWSVEYRRVGATGGGWPGTFQDAAAGMDYAAMLADRFPLALDRVLTMGHSAGGHLAFWCAGRHHVPHGSAVESQPRVALRGTVALAGAVDLQRTIALSSGVFAHDREQVVRLMGGGPAEVPERYRAGDPGELLPLTAPQCPAAAPADDQIPPDLPEQWAAKARQTGSAARVVLLPGADHFDVVDPESKAFGSVLRETRRLLGLP